jgi:hypothetical protein
MWVYLGPVCLIHPNLKGETRGRHCLFKGVIFKDMGAYIYTYKRHHFSFFPYSILLMKKTFVAKAFSLPRLTFLRGEKEDR